MNLNEKKISRIVDTVSEKIVDNKNTPPHNMMKKMNRFVNKLQNTTEQDRLLIALLVFNGLISVDDNN